jgi:hypothetical protein
MHQAISDLAAPDLAAPLMARCLSVRALLNNKADVRAALHQGSSNHVGPDLVLMVLADVRIERWIINHQDRKAPRVRHRRLP